MKHENATSADNAQVAATIRHTLTFEEVYAMTYVRESIECLLDQNLRQYPILNGYKDDLRQEILIRLNDELPVFDPEKSSFNTFFRRVLHAAMYDARKVYFRNQNLTLRFAAELEDFESDDTDSIPAESLAAYARYSKNTVEEEMLKQDVHAIIQTCSPELQKVANALLAGCSIRFLARQHQMTVPRFRRMYIRPLRKAFEKNF